MTRIGALVLALCIAGPAVAQVDLVPGRFVKIVDEWDSKGLRFTGSPPEGEQDACFRIKEVGQDGVRMTHVSGLYHPWWSAEARPIGKSDLWFSSDAYKEAVPTADNLTMLRRILANVPRC